MSTEREIPTYNHPRHPAWLRVWLYGMDHDGQALAACQLRDACDLDSRTLNRGLSAARKMNLITADSHARCVRVQHLPSTWRASA